jgi:hypothetical protein
MSLESCLDDIAAFILNIDSESMVMIPEPEPEPNSESPVLSIDNRDEFIISCNFDPIYNNQRYIHRNQRIEVPPPYNEIPPPYNEVRVNYITEPPPPYE